MPRHTQTIKQSGFTLVEIMAVVMIIGVMVSLAAVSIGGQGERELKKESQRVFQKLRLAQDEAEILASEMGVQIKDNQFSFFKYSESSMSWLEQEGIYGNVKLESEYTVELKSENEKIHIERLYSDKIQKKDGLKKINNKKSVKEPQIFFFSDGQISPFELRISSKYTPKAGYIIKGETPSLLNISAYE